MEKRSYRLEMQGISKRFGGTCALNNVSIKVKPGEIHALIGENGAGKSTLIKILSGAYIKDEGEIFINGDPVDITTPLAAKKTWGSSYISGIYAGTRSERGGKYIY